MGRDHQVIRDMFGNPRYEMRQFGFDEKTLREIADMTGARYFRAADVKALAAVYSEIDKLEKSTIEMTQHHDSRDLFPWFLGAGLVVFAGQLTLAQTVWRRLP
jgi:Ca-activated chloride channel family protein